MRTFLLFAALVLVGCTTASVKRVGPPRPARPEKAFVSVYAGKDAPFEIQKHPVVEGGRPGALKAGQQKMAKQERREVVYLKTQLVAVRI